MAWLVFRSGSMAGTRYPLLERRTRLGRSPDNNIVINGPECAMISEFHAEISKGDTGFRIRDLASASGIFLDGRRISEAELRASATIQLGSQGPELVFIADRAA